MKNWIFRTLTLAVTLLVTMPTSAAEPNSTKKSDPANPIKQTSGAVVTGQSCPPGGCAQPNGGDCATCNQGAPAKSSRFKNLLSRCGGSDCSDCDAELHCTSCKSDLRFIFGNCKSFFGTRNRCAPPHGYVGPQSGPCEYGTFHRY